MNEHGQSRADDPAILRWQSFIKRFQTGEWRAPVFHDMVMADLAQMEAPVVLDIGCGRGFDDDPGLQRSLANRAGRYIGVEPDSAMQVADVFETCHRSFFEDAPIEPASVDLAFSVMVLEHIDNPAPFWEKLREVLKPGGIFWGFTIDSRHWFAHASNLMQRLGAKDRYLNLIHGRKGEERYENYPARYLSNTPAEIRDLAGSMHECTVLNFHKLGALDYYLPAGLRWLGRATDRVTMARKNSPGIILAVRAVN